ncbi:hypothetical protein KFK09_008672 [Dendrobium nobile]|uniref:RNase H type-1 domain-containing protein n=1 Tax=Dendrobium nobile TaxID=94219 RepID=A0A8T3BLC0_DENNO|nr:hypothetical protein KFK09_008672 [Dendrobium nobile]
MTALASSYKSENNKTVEYGEWLKKIKLNPRIQCFWWRILNEAIPANDFLMKRRLLGHNSCPRGCVEQENTDHVMVHCSKLQQAIGTLRKWGFLCPLFSSINDCKFHLKILSEENKSMANLYCSIVYFTWNSRNQLKHGNNEWSVNFIACNAISYASISTSYLLMDHWDANQPSRLISFWHPPPPEWIKVNFDAALTNNNNGGIGGVFRDSKGRFLLAFGISCIRWDIGTLELIAIRSLKNFISNWMLDAKGLIVECDNLNIIKLLQRSKNNGSRNGFQEDIEDLSFLDGFGNFLFHFVNRNCNALAHNCANHALVQDFFGEDLNSNKVPPSFFYVLREQSDRISIT